MLKVERKSESETIVVPLSLDMMLISACLVYICRNLKMVRLVQMLDYLMRNCCVAV